jgi:hypothetical protein
MMSSSPRLSLLIPCQSAPAGKVFPCYSTALGEQAIDFLYVVPASGKISPAFSLLAGKNDRTPAPFAAVCRTIAGQDLNEWSAR